MEQTGFAGCSRPNPLYRVFLIRVEADTHDEGFIYFLDTDNGSRAKEVLSALVDTLVDRLTFAIIDGFPDESWPIYEKLDAETKEAHQRLVTEGAKREGKAGSTKMGIRLNLADPDHVNIVRNYGPASIHLELHGGESEPITLHDEGTSCSAPLTSSELARLKAALERRGLPVTLISPPHRKARFGRYRPV